MSRTTTVLAALGGMIASAGIITAVTGRSRPPIEGLEGLNVPHGLPPARLITLPDRGEVFLRDQPGPSQDSPTVVLLHGWVVSGDLNWFTSFGPLSDLARVIAPDHRGHGRGTRHSVPYRLADVADDVAAVIRALDAGPAVLVGYSMGGPIAQLVWQRHPDVVSGMVLCATASQFRFGPTGGAHWHLMGIYQTVLRLLPRVWLERIVLAQMRGTAPVRLVRSIGTEVSDMVPLLPWAVGEVERGHVEDIAEAGRQMGRFDSRGWLRGLDVPAAMVITTRDRMVPPATQLELAALLPHSLVIEVDGDHDVTAGHPKAFTEGLVQAVQHVLDER
ncbi:hypothetical protein BH23ACT9_BH23ACT9_18530 [soil metagenome]